MRGASFLALKAMLKDGDRGAILQRDKRTYAVVPHLPCGMVSVDQLRQIASVAEKYRATLKVTSAARIAIIGLEEHEVDAVWRELGLEPGHATGERVRSVKACPGTEFCRFGKQDALTLGLELDRRYHGATLPAKLKMGVSGCVNQCAETGIKDIGLVGKAKGWTLLVGGNAGAHPRLAVRWAEGFSTEEALAAVGRLIDIFRSEARRREKLADFLDRAGLDQVKARVLSPESSAVVFAQALD